MTEQDLERMDMRVLLDIYMQEAREFSAALESGASWEELRRLRSRVKLVSTMISRKYDHQHSSGDRRRDNRPPHGD